RLGRVVALRAGAANGAATSATLYDKSLDIEVADKSRLVLVGEDDVRTQLPDHGLELGEAGGADGGRGRKVHAHSRRETCRSERALSDRRCEQAVGGEMQPFAVGEPGRIELVEPDSGRDAAIAQHRPAAVIGCNGDH